MKNTQSNIPFGGGLNYEIGVKTTLSFEFVGRFLSTDYLDDLSTNYIDPSLFANYLQTEDAELVKIMHNKSNLIDPDIPFQVRDQRGNSKKNNLYSFFNIKLNIRISKFKTSKFLKKHYKFDDSEICD